MTDSVKSHAHNVTRYITCRSERLPGRDYFAITRKEYTTFPLNHRDRIRYSENRRKSVTRQLKKKKKKKSNNKIVKLLYNIIIVVAR